MEPVNEIPSANAAFPYEDKLAAARRYLDSRGITEPRPLYRASRASAAEPAAGRALQRARARWFVQPPAAADAREADQAACGG